MISDVYKHSQEPPTPPPNKTPISASITAGTYVSETTTRYLLLLCPYAVPLETYRLRPFKANKPQKHPKRT